jgi:hypothetical protein
MQGCINSLRNEILGLVSISAYITCSIEGGITADTTTDGIKHRQIGIHCSSESILMGIVNVLTVIQHPSAMVIMMVISICGINGYTIINTD